MQNMDYKKLIIQHLQKINDERFLRYLYTLITEMVEKQSKKE